MLFFTSNDVVACVSSWMFIDMSAPAYGTHNCLLASPWIPPQGQGRVTEQDCEGPLWRATTPQDSARSSHARDKPGCAAGICPSVPDWPSALSRASQWDADMNEESIGDSSRQRLSLTHLQVKELAVPPVDSLRGGVGPGHVDNVHLWEKRRSR